VADAIAGNPYTSQLVARSISPPLVFVAASAVAVLLGRGEHHGEQVAADHQQGRDEGAEDEPGREDQPQRRAGEHVQQAGDRADPGEQQHGADAGQRRAHPTGRRRLVPVASHIVTPLVDVHASLLFGSVAARHARTLLALTRRDR